jgi:K+-transporting ATPase ATPase A chain
MNTEILGVALQILLLLVISYPLGKHIAKVYKEGNDCMRFMAPIERFIYKLAGINPNEEMDWKAFLKSLRILVLLGYDPVGIARISSFES